MNVTEFLERIKVSDYYALENQTMLEIIKCCDAKTKAVFFPDAPQVYPMTSRWQEVAVKLVAYTIRISKNSKFNEISGIKDMKYAQIGDLLNGNRVLWRDVFCLIVLSIYPDFEIDFIDTFYDNTITDQFIHFACMQVEQFPQFPPFCFNMIRNFRSSHFQTYCEKWKEYSQNDNLINLFAHEAYLSSYHTSPQLVSGIASSVNAAMELRTNYEIFYTTEQRDRCGTTETRFIWHEIYDAGFDVCQWLKADHTRKYVPNLNEIPNSHTERVTVSDWPPEPSGGCVTGATLISLADGTSVEIANMTEGCSILSEGERVSITSDELVINHRIKKLYGINDIPPFMSLEHAVMTVAGWKSLAPEISNQINPYFQVSLLREGDQIITLDGKIKVDKITLLTAPQGETFTGYDLHFREGVPSYFANGILVLLNYPELTLSRVKKNLASMEASERERLFTLVSEHAGLFTQVLGESAIGQFLLESSEQTPAK